jgi:hypothetical protein
VANHHAHCTGYEERLAAELVEEEDGGEGEDDLKDASDAGGEEGCCGIGEAEGFKYLRRVVKDSIDARL